MVRSRFPSRVFLSGVSAFDVVENVRFLSRPWGAGLGGSVGWHDAKFVDVCYKQDSVFRSMIPERMLEVMRVLAHFTFSDGGKRDTRRRRDP